VSVHRDRCFFRAIRIWESESASDPGLSSLFLRLKYFPHGLLSSWCFLPSFRPLLFPTCL
jgi:hypothetical protein